MYITEKVSATNEISFLIDTKYTFKMVETRSELNHNYHCPRIAITPFCYGLNIDLSDAGCVQKTLKEKYIDATLFLRQVHTISINSFLTITINEFISNNEKKKILTQLVNRFISGNKLFALENISPVCK